MAYPPQNDADTLVKITNISVVYGDNWALKNVFLTFNHSEIHAIVGEHGAGKSSLGMILSGLLKPQIGRITFAGKDYQSLTLKTARALGIDMVHQHALSVTPYFTIAENFALGVAPMYTLRRKKHTIKAVREFFAQYAVNLDPTLPVNRLSPSEQIFVDILKHIYNRPKFLILDEPLEKLTAPLFEKVVSMLMQLKQAGTTIMLITHRIDDIYQLADRVSVIKHGEVLLTDDTKNIDKINLIKMAYMQISANQDIDDLNKEFYHLLKYNEAILQNLPINLMIADNESRIKMVNDHCKRSFHLDHIRYVNMPLSEALSSANQDVAALLNSPSLPPDEQTLYQIPLTFHDVTIASNMKIFPIYDGTFRIGNILIFEDMTEYDQLQKQVMLSEKLASVGLLAAGVAHEINNPLEIIYNSLTYLKYHIHQTELKDAVEDIHNEMRAIAQIVSNLHSFSDNKRDLNEEVDINDLIQNMLKLLQYNAAYKHIAVHFEPDEDDDFMISANQNEIKQVFLNLFKNSFEAMPSGGDIFIHTAGVSDQPGMPHVKITFKDTGPGIGDENPSNVFLPFYSTKKEQEQNLGLGLSVSYGIVTKYHGTITVENVDDAGCQFIITLPRHV